MLFFWAGGTAGATLDMIIQISCAGQSLGQLAFHFNVLGSCAQSSSLVFVQFQILSEGFPQNCRWIVRQQASNL